MIQFIERNRGKILVYTLFWLLMGVGMGVGFAELIN